MSLRPPARRPPARARAAAALLAAGLALTGCGGGLGQQQDAGDRKGYIAGDGSVLEVAAEDRGAPVAVAGQATDGSAADLAALRGEVVVLNFWYAGCAPCRAEADDLAAAAQANPGVRFLGVNTRDELATANAFERTYTVPYPSLLDAGSGEAVLALTGLVSPQSIPATIVLDRAGRPAARVLGPIEPGIFQDLLDAVVEEPA